MNIGSVESHDILFKVGRIRYAALHANDVNIQLTFPRPPQSIRLVTVLHCDEKASIGKDWLENCLKRADKHDDVFCPAFVQGLILITDNSSGASTRTELTQDARRHLSTIGNQWLQISSPHELPKGLDPGVYHLSGLKLKRVFRLYDDVNKVFLTTLEPRSQAR